MKEIVIFNSFNRRNGDLPSVMCKAYSTMTDSRLKTECSRVECKTSTLMDGWHENYFFFFLVLPFHEKQNELSRETRKNTHHPSWHISWNFCMALSRGTFHGTFHGILHGAFHGTFHVALVTHNSSNPQRASCRL